MEPVPPAVAVQSQPLGSQGGPMKTFLIVASCGVLLASVLLNILHSEKSIQGVRSDRVPEELWTEVRDIV